MRAPQKVSEGPGLSPGPSLEWNRFWIADVYGDNMS